MNPSSITSPWARLAFGLLCVMWMVTGWYILWVGSFETTPRRSRQTTLVDGAGADAMSLIFIALGLIALLIFLQSVRVGKLGQALAGIGVLAVTLLLFIFR